MAPGFMGRVMTIGGDYPTPVQVNGFSCRNCTDVDYAKKHIDPAHPRSGPYDINAENDPSRTFSSAGKEPNRAGPAPSSSYSAGAQSVLAADAGRNLDLTA